MGWGLTWLPLFWKYWYIYFFCDSLVNVCVFIVFFFFFFVLFLYAVFSAVKTNEGHSQRSNCRKHHHPVLSSYRCWRCMWLRLGVWVSVCAHTSRCNMELLLAMKEHFDCQYFLVLKKRKEDHPVPLRLFCSSPSSPSHSTVRPNKLVHSCNQNVLVYVQLLLPVAVDRGGGLVGEPEMEQGLAPSRLWFRSSVQTDRAGRRSEKEVGTNSTFANTSGLFVQPSCCKPVWCSAQQNTSWSSQVFLCQTDPGHGIKLLLDTNTVTFYLTIKQ